MPAAAGPHVASSTAAAVWPSEAGSAAGSAPAGCDQRSHSRRLAPPSPRSAAVAHRRDAAAARQCERRTGLSVLFPPRPPQASTPATLASRRWRPRSTWCAPAFPSQPRLPPAYRRKRGAQLLAASYVCDPPRATHLAGPQTYPQACHAAALTRLLLQSLRPAAQQPGVRGAGGGAHHLQAPVPQVRPAPLAVPRPEEAGGHRSILPRRGA